MGWLRDVGRACGAVRSGALALLVSGIGACVHHASPLLGNEIGVSHSREAAEASRNSARPGLGEDASKKLVSSPAANAPVAPEPLRCDGTRPETLRDSECPKPPDWRDDTRSLEVRDTAHVLADPRPRARYIGKITRGTRVAWTQVIARAALEAAAPDTKARARSRRDCEYWVNIVPSGWLCSDKLKPSTSAPEGRRQPIVLAGSFVPAAYYAILNDGTPSYASPDDVRARAVSEVLSKRIMLVGSGAVAVDEVTYLKTDHGLVEQSALGKFSPSLFGGIDLRVRAVPAWPFAWLGGPRGARPTIYREPNKEAEIVRKAARREIVPLLEERDGFVRIADNEWIERSELRVASVTPPPPGVQANEQWIDVDLDEQVLIAYEGTAPVFATLVSTGRKHHNTPAGLYRVRAKAATTPMIGGEKDDPNRYEVSEVPWAIRFRSGLFIHGAYWHDAFGNIVSHGCVNVSPKDAVFLFDWVEPRLPDGWSEIEVPPGAGAMVRVRDRLHPAPEPFDYAKEEPWNYRPDNTGR